MNIEDAYRLLGLTPSSSENECRVAYDALRDKLEKKLVKAPTSGLKEKYRRSLRQVEDAFDQLNKSADGGDLPVTKLAPAEPSPRPLSPPATEAPAAASTQTSTRRSYSDEITKVAAALIAAILLGVWFMSGANDEEIVLAELPALETNIAATSTSLRQLLKESESSGIELRVRFLKLLAIDKYVKIYKEHLENAKNHQLDKAWGDARDEMDSASEQHEEFKKLLDEEWAIYNKQK